MSRIKLSFARGLEVEFCDRERAIQQVEEIAGEGTRLPVVVYGPEGCGKTSWLLQAVEVLKDLGFSIIYFNPLRRMFLSEVGVKSIEERVQEVLKQASSEYVLARFVWSIIDLAREAIKIGRRKLTIIVDDAFQLIDAREASLIVKGLLEIIEYPPASYEKIVAIAATSEGISRIEIGRHLWAWIKLMWNMSGKGFEELYGKIPGSKPLFEDVLGLTGGNPRILAQLYQADWNTETVVKSLIDSKKLDAFISSLSNDERIWLSEAVNDPDTLFTRERIQLLNKLVNLNLAVDAIPGRELNRWIDEPPPEKDLELGIGRHVAWQTPLHKEAIKKTLTA
jgi:ABC-type phosphate/phosphonate transport system ATPase subunit